MSAYQSTPNSRLEIRCPQGHNPILAEGEEPSIRKCQSSSDGGSVNYLFVGSYAKE
jgi:hypothetical protein